MKKQTVNEEISFDFGFSTVGEDEIKISAPNYEEKLQALYKLVMPLLDNLSKDEGKDYIYWPDRINKVAQFKQKIQRIMND